MQKIDAVLFDIDGTLLDTSNFIFEAFEYSIKSHGGPITTRQKIAEVVGKPLSECYQLLYPSGDTMMLCDAHNTFQIQHLHLSIPFKHTIHVLNKIQLSEKKIAAITSRTKESAEKILELANIHHYFDIFLAAEDVEHHKPHPEALMKALDVLQVSPNHAVMIGDTSADIGAGKNAGTFTIGVTYGFHGEKIRDSNPDFVVRDIQEIIPLIL